MTSEATPPNFQCLPGYLRHKHKRGGSSAHRLLALWGILIGCLGMPSSWAEIPFATPVEINAQGTPIIQFLTEFLQEQGIPAVVNPQITGTISGHFDEEDARKVFNRVMSAYNLVWTYDGNILYIDSFLATDTQFIETPYVSGEALIEVLDAFGVECSHGIIKTVGNQPIVMISGPQRYVQIVDNFILQLNTTEASQQSTKIVIEVFRLKYAWAYNLTFNYRSNSIIIPGVSTILQSLVGGGDSLNNTSSTLSGASTPTSVPTLTPNTNAPAWPSSEEVADGQSAPSPPAGEAAGLEPSSFTKITSDNRINAVIIRDTADKMDAYRTLIQQLDQPIEVIAISVAVIDLSVNNSLGLGVQSFSWNDGYSSFDSNSLGDLGTSTTANMAASVVFNGMDFLADIQALQDRGEANILSRPSVMTFDNMQATISNTETYYIDVPGSFANNLYQVSTGLTLDVVPHLIQLDQDEVTLNNGEPAQSQTPRMISLLVDVTDGYFNTTSTLTTSTPTEEVNLSTQAVLYENQSLLIGGIYSNNQSNVESGIPLLMDIPLIGFLFKNTTRSIQKTERLFLITPSVIELNAFDSSPYSSYFQVEPLSSTVPADKVRDKVPQSQILKATGQNPNLPNVFEAAFSSGLWEFDQDPPSGENYRKTPTGYYKVPSAQTNLATEQAQQDAYSDQHLPPPRMTSSTSYSLPPPHPAPPSSGYYLLTPDTTSNTPTPTSEPANSNNSRLIKRTRAQR